MALYFSAALSFIKQTCYLKQVCASFIAQGPLLPPPLTPCAPPLVVCTGQVDAVAGDNVAQLSRMFTLLLRNMKPAYAAEQARLVGLPPTTRAPYRYGSRGCSLAGHAVVSGWRPCRTCEERIALPRVG